MDHFLHLHTSDLFPLGSNPYPILSSQYKLPTCANDLENPSVLPIAKQKFYADLSALDVEEYYQKGVKQALGAFMVPVVYIPSSLEIPAGIYCVRMMRF